MSTAADRRSGPRTRSATGGITAGKPKRVFISFAYGRALLGGAASAFDLTGSHHADYRALDELLFSETAYTRVSADFLAAAKLLSGAAEKVGCEIELAEQAQGRLFDPAQFRKR